MIQWMGLTLFAICLQAFFALFEMGSVSMNKIRLQYSASRGEKWALWTQYLLKKPSRLFGTTLIGINVGLQLGSEYARRFYESIHVDPDWAPVSQVILVVVFAELVPLFTARRHPDQIVRAFAPLMAGLAYLLSPLIWVFDRLSRMIHWLLSKPQEAPLFLSRDEVRMAFEENHQKEDDLTAVIHSIFQLKAQTAEELMLPLSQTIGFSMNTPVSEVRKKLSQKYAPVFPLFQKNPEQIGAIVSVRDLLPAQDSQQISQWGKAPWFVIKSTSVLQILDQFRRNNQTVAVILDASGQACGLLTLDQIVDAIFGFEGGNLGEEEPVHFVARTLEGTMRIGAFNQQFEADLPGDESETLAHLILSRLDHPPAKGEIFRIGSYEFTVLEPTVRGIKTLSVHTLQE